MRSAANDLPARDPLAPRAVAGIALAALGIGLALGAAAVPQASLDAHFLPIFFVSHPAYVLGETLARAAIAAAGVALVVAARPFARFVGRTPPRTLAADAARLALALALALGASELVLRYSFDDAKEAPPAAEEPRRQADPRLGWVFVPARLGRDAVGGRVIDYAFDGAGYRVRGVDEPVDSARPTILFAGESIMAGYGLGWEESVPAQVASLLGVQSANLAGFGYASDQAYLRLAQEIPRFHRPVAVVSLFMPVLFDRNLDDDRPHLAPDLRWLPPVHRWRLWALAQWLVPYRTDAEIERGIAATRAVLRATVDLARARGALPLILVPELGDETAMERTLPRRILEESDLPYLEIHLDPAWRLPGDSHPDARAAHAIAVAVARRLARLGVLSETP
jgi:hypothetical protein